MGLHQALIQTSSKLSASIKHPSRVWLNPLMLSILWSCLASFSGEMKFVFAYEIMAHQTIVINLN
jgi:hypothetical protein